MSARVMLVNWLSAPPSRLRRAWYVGVQCGIGRLRCPERVPERERGAGQTRSAQPDANLESVRVRRWRGTLRHDAAAAHARRASSACCRERDVLAAAQIPPANRAHPAMVHLRERNWRGVQITGPYMDRDDVVGPRNHPAAVDVEIIPMAADVPSYLAAADAVLCMEGCNTTCEVLGLAVPARPRRCAHHRRLVVRAPTPCSFLPFRKGDGPCELVNTGRARRPVRTIRPTSRRRGCCCSAMRRRAGTTQGGARAGQTRRSRRPRRPQP